MRMARKKVEDKGFATKKAPGSRKIKESCSFFIQSVFDAGTRACLQTQHLGGRGRRAVGSRTAWAIPSESFLKSKIKKRRRTERSFCVFRFDKMLT